jgi:hypothetical protein
LAHPDFGRSVNPISTSGGGKDYAHLITTGTFGFLDVEGPVSPVACQKVPCKDFFALHDVFIDFSLRISLTCVFTYEDSNVKS